ncbi:hypothetical protein [Rhizobium mongolense]|uniref:Uncharacterized protein n=1 Tax=Rhizobium mongolense TaxID=57676 RepID=A0A7W6WGA6_9HYPH|nr:hypothetical protein [Rhizobium mongolense]MBB4277056.1 hypothetical protein [Rhizobium mongolense]
MTMFTEEITIDFATTEDANILEWISSVGLARETAPDLTFQMDFDITPDLEDFSDEEIIDAFRDVSEAKGNWLSRTYRFIAEGDTRAALEELHQQFPQVLRPPQAELALVLRLGTGGGMARG